MNPPRPPSQARPRRGLRLTKCIELASSPLPLKPHTAHTHNGCGWFGGDVAIWCGGVLARGEAAHLHHRQRWLHRVAPGEALEGRGAPHHRLRLEAQRAHGGTSALALCPARPARSFILAPSLDAPAATLWHLVGPRGCHPQTAPGCSHTNSSGWHQIGSGFGAVGGSRHPDSAVVWRSWANLWAPRTCIVRAA